MILNKKINPSQIKFLISTLVVADWKPPTCLFGFGMAAAADTHLRCGLAISALCCKGGLEAAKHCPLV